MGKSRDKRKSRRLPPLLWLCLAAAVVKLILQPAKKDQIQQNGSSSLFAAIKNRASDIPDGVVYVFYREASLWKGGSGGVESLHRLHSEINKLHAAGKIGVRSVFPGGSDFYKTQYSNHTELIQDFQSLKLTAADYVVFPEGYGAKLFGTKSSNRALNFANLRHLEASGAIPMVIYLGQHSDRLQDTIELKSNKHICRSKYFADLYGCEIKATLITPMNESFIEAANEMARTKENIVLLDPDPLNKLDPGKIVLPAGAKLVLLKDFTRKGIMAMYAKSKIIIDSYITGTERAVFESSLFDVFPLVARHGNALNSADFNIPDKYKWDHYDYDYLNSLIADVLAHHEARIKEVKPFQEFVRSMPDNFAAAVERYFKDDMHIIIYGGKKMKDQAYLALIWCKSMFPFTSQELFVDDGFYYVYDKGSLFEELSYSGAKYDTNITSIDVKYSHLGPSSVYVQPPAARHYREFVLLLPPNVLPAHPDSLGILYSHAMASNSAIILGPHNVALVRRSKYYAMAQSIASSLEKSSSVGLGDLFIALGLDVTKVSFPSTPGKCDYFVNLQQQSKRTCGCYQEVAAALSSHIFWGRHWQTLKRYGNLNYC